MNAVDNYVVDAVNRVDTDTDAVDVMLLTLLPFVISALVRLVTIHKMIEGRQ